MVWRTCDEEAVKLSEGGAVAAMTGDDGRNETLATSDVELTAGKALLGGTD
jgi:hypothetical protein